MSSTQLTTFADLYTDLLQRVRVSTSTAGSVEQAKRYINIALHDIHLGFEYKLPWCERRWQLTTHAPYSDGTVTATVGSTAVVGFGTLWNTNNAHSVKNARSTGKMIIEDSQVVYGITNVQSDTTIALRASFVAENSVSAGTYTYFEDEYDLTSTFLRPIDSTMFSPDMQIALIPRHEFRRRYPVVRISGRPRVACIVDGPTTPTDFTPVRRVVFYPYPDKTYVIPYTYISSALAIPSGGASTLTSMSSDTDTPIMPLRYRHAILYHALAKWYRDKKDDARAEQANADYTDIMMRVVSDDDMATKNTAYLQPQMGQYTGAAKAPYRRSRGGKIYDVNGEFDAFRR